MPPSSLALYNSLGYNSKSSMKRAHKNAKLGSQQPGRLETEEDKVATGAALEAAWCRAAKDRAVSKMLHTMHCRPTQRRQYCRRGGGEDAIT
jgi:hypothetical protein